VTVKDFKKCCISNAGDGTDDDMFWKDTGDMNGQKCSVGGNCLSSLFLINLHDLETHCAESKE
jgi:hypothetical protein